MHGERHAGRCSRLLCVRFSHYRLSSPLGEGVLHQVKYILITAARNEESFITKTLDSVVTQTVLPERWIIVDDGSTDGTAEIVRAMLSATHGFNCFAVRGASTEISPEKSKRSLPA